MDQSIHAQKILDGGIATNDANDLNQDNDQLSLDLDTTGFNVEEHFVKDVEKVETRKAVAKDCKGLVDYEIYSNDEEEEGDAEIDEDKTMKSRNVEKTNMDFIDKNMPSEQLSAFVRVSDQNNSQSTNGDVSSPLVVSPLSPPWSSDGADHTRNVMDQKATNELTSLNKSSLFESSTEAPAMPQPINRQTSALGENDGIHQIPTTTSYTLIILPSGKFIKTEFDPDNSTNFLPANSLKSSNNGHACSSSNIFEGSAVLDINNIDLLEPELDAVDKITENGNFTHCTNFNSQNGVFPSNQSQNEGQIQQAAMSVGTPRPFRTDYEIRFENVADEPHNRIVLSEHLLDGGSEDEHIGGFIPDVNNNFQISNGSFTEAVHHGAHFPFFGLCNGAAHIPSAKDDIEEEESEINAECDACTKIVDLFAASKDIEDESDYRCIIDEVHDESHVILLSSSSSDEDSSDDSESSNQSCRILKRRKTEDFVRFPTSPFPVRVDMQILSERGKIPQQSHRTQQRDYDRFQSSPLPPDYFLSPTSGEPRRRFARTPINSVSSNLLSPNEKPMTPTSSKAGRSERRLQQRDYDRFQSSPLPPDYFLSPTSGEPRRRFARTPINSVSPNLLSPNEKPMTPTSSKAGRSEHKTSISSVNIFKPTSNQIAASKNKQQSPFRLYGCLEEFELVASDLGLYLTRIDPASRNGGSQIQVKCPTVVFHADEDALTTGSKLLVLRQRQVPLDEYSVVSLSEYIKGETFARTRWTVVERDQFISAVRGRTQKYFMTKNGNSDRRQNVDQVELHKGSPIQELRTGTSERSSRKRPRRHSSNNLTVKKQLVNSKGNEKAAFEVNRVLAVRCPRRSTGDGIPTYDKTQDVIQPSTSRISVDRGNLKNNRMVIPSLASSSQVRRLSTRRAG